MGKVKPFTPGKQSVETPASRHAMGRVKKISAKKAQIESPVTK